MFDLQMKMLAAMTEFSTACAAQMLEGPQSIAGTASGEKDAGRDRRTQAMALPEIPTTGRSWYRAPVENPVLAFWDSMLQPWRTFVPAPGAASTGTAFAMWPGFSSPQTISGPDAMMAAFAPALAVWQGATASAASSSSTVPTATTPQSTDTDAWKTAVAYHSDAGMAVARVFFPDHATMTVNVPVPNTIFPGFKSSF